MSDQSVPVNNEFCAPDLRVYVGSELLSLVCLIFTKASTLVPWGVTWTAAIWNNKRIVIISDHHSRAIVFDGRRSKEDYLLAILDDVGRLHNPIWCYLQTEIDKSRSTLRPNAVQVVMDQFVFIGSTAGHGESRNYILSEID